MRKSFVIGLLVVSGLLLLTACGGHSTPPAISVSINPSVQTNIDVGQTLNLTAAVANDSGNKGVQWSISGTGCTGNACGTLSNSTSTKATYIAPATATANMTVTIQATSAADTTKSSSEMIVVSPEPTITTSTLVSGTVGTAYSVTLHSSGGAGSLTWSLASGSSLPAGLSLSSAGVISGTATAAGTTGFTVKVTDASGANEGQCSQTQQLSIMIKPAVLTVTTTSLPNGVVGTAYSNSITTTGGTGNVSLAVSAGSLPGGLTLSSAGAISGTPTTAATSTFTVTATDSSTPVQTASQQLSITINPKLVISTTSLAGAALNKAYSATLQSSGGVGTISWTVTSGSLPTGLTLSTAGTISGTPTVAGTSNFTVTAKDSGTPQQSVQQALTLTVTAGLTVTTTSLAGGTVNSSYSSTLQSAGGTAPVTWSVSQGSLPGGLTLSSAGAISGTPTTAGTSTFTVKATDASSPAQTATQQLSIVVNPALSITTTTLPNGTVGTAYSQNVVSSGGTLPISWSLASGNLPAGLNVQNGSNGEATIDGTPTTAGSYTFTLKATDSSTPAANVSQQFTIVISAPALVIVTTTLPNGKENTAYSAQLQASGGTTPYTWAVATGSSLPGWLSLTSSGALSGTPSTAAAATFTLTVTDSSSPKQSQNVTLTLTVVSATACGTGNESKMKGQFAFIIHGYTNDGFLGVVGSFTADGNGHITAGYADTNSGLVSGNGVGITSANITTTGSSYTLGSDNRGCYTIVTPKYTFNGRFALSPTPAGAAQGTMMDLSYTATGKIFQQQVPTAVPTGNWVYVQYGELQKLQTGASLVGVDVYASGGQITNGEYNSPGGTTGSGITGTYTAPNSTTGRYTLTTTLSGVSINRAAYLVSGTKALEITADSSTILAGEMQLQSGSLTLSGTLATYGSSQYAPVAGFGLMNATGSSYTANYYIEDTTHGGTWAVPTPTPTTCSFTIDALGKVVTSGSTCGSNYGYVGSTLTWGTPPVFYLTGPSTGVLVGGAGVWYVAPQTATSITNGNYYFGTQFSWLGSGIWEGSSGVVAVTGGDVLTGMGEVEGVGPNVPVSQTLTMNSDGTFTSSINPGVVLGLVVSNSQFVEVEDSKTTVPRMQIYNIMP